MFLVQGWWAHELNTAHQAVHPGHSSALTPPHTVSLKQREAASRKSGDHLGNLNKPFLHRCHRLSTVCLHLVCSLRENHSTRKVHGGSVEAHPPGQLCNLWPWDALCRSQDRANPRGHTAGHTRSLRPWLISHGPAHVAAGWQGRETLTMWHMHGHLPTGAGTHLALSHCYQEPRDCPGWKHRHSCPWAILLRANTPLLLQTQYFSFLFFADIVCYRGGGL